MFSLSRRAQLTGCLIVAGIGLTVFFGHGFRPWFDSLALPYELIGASLLIAATWFFVDAVQRVPADESLSPIAPGEWQSWVGVVFCAALLGSMLVALQSFSEHLPLYQNPDASRAGRGVGTLIVSWAILAYVLEQRWKVRRDERDRQIEHQSGQWGRAAATIAIVAIAVLLSFSPTERLQAWSYPAIGHLLIVAVVIGAFVDHAVAAVLYWRDRRQTGEP
jgi:L-asparagine transporter-like permease